MPSAGTAQEGTTRRGSHSSTARVESTAVRSLSDRPDPLRRRLVTQARQAAHQRMAYQRAHKPQPSRMDGSPVCTEHALDGSGVMGARPAASGPHVARAAPAMVADRSRWVRAPLPNVRGPMTGTFDPTWWSKRHETLAPCWAQRNGPGSVTWACVRPRWRTSTRCSSASAAHWRGCRQVPCPSTSGSRWPAAHPHRGRSERTGCAGARSDGRRVMTTMVVDSAEYSVAAAMTVGQLRDLIGDLADDTPLHIGVYGHHHFNSVLGTMPVTSARVEPIPGGVIVLLHVPGIS